MTNWMLLGFVLAAAMVVIRLFQGVLINAWQTQSGLISIALVLLFVVTVAVWGMLDGRANAAANPDPDRRQDLAMTWLRAGLVAGVLSGAVSWLISLSYKGLYVGGILNELTTFAAFTALMVFLPGIIGVALGGWQVDRKAPPASKRGRSTRRVDTDVFTTVRADETPTGELPVSQAEEQTTPPAVATTERENKTETIATTENISATEMIRAHTDETNPGHDPKKDQPATPPPSQ